MRRVQIQSLAGIGGTLKRTSWSYPGCTIKSLEGRRPPTIKGPQRGGNQGVGGGGGKALEGRRALAGDTLC